MSTRRTYLTCCLLLLLITVTSFLFGGYGRKQEFIQTGDRSFAVHAGTLFLSVGILPTLIALSLACGGLGCIQDWVVLPGAMKRILAYLFAAGILLLGVADYTWVESNIGDELFRIRVSRWIGFPGIISLTFPVLLDLYGLGRHAFRTNGGNRLQRPSKITGEKDMRAAKCYALGGLLLIMWVLLRSYFWRPPWLEPRAVGLSGVSAGLFTWPLAAALGAAALFLSVLQSLVAIHERIKLAGGIAYFAGASLFLVSLYGDLLREQPWKNSIRWTTATGLAILLIVLLLNLVGMLRSREKPERDISLAAD